MVVGRTVVGGAGVAIVGYLLLASPAHAADPLPLPVPAGLPIVQPVAPLVATVLTPVRDAPLTPVLRHAPRLVADPPATPSPGLAPRPLTPVTRSVPPPRPATTVARRHPSRDTVGYPVPSRAPVNPAPAAPVPRVPLWWPVYPVGAPAAGAGPHSGTRHDVAPVRVSGAPASDTPRAGGTTRPQRPRLPRGPPPRPAFRPD